LDFVDINKLEVDYSPEQKAYLFDDYEDPNQGAI
jgi:hypothetical protein